MRRYHVSLAPSVVAGLMFAVMLGVYPMVAWAGQSEAEALSRELLDRYCVTCHNQRLQTGGLSLDGLDLAQVGTNAPVLEKVVHKLRSGQMPPEGRPRPAPEVVDTFATSLERALDQVAEMSPNPGRVSSRRLNRVEYANVIEDLLGLEIDSEELLPSDMAGFGFDNNADVLSITPELYFGDPDGVVVQLQDSTYCGGEGLLGEVCLATPEPAPTDGLLQLQDYNHFTIFVTDQSRSIALYQQLFGMPVDTYQGALPVLRVGTGNQFLALAGAGGGPSGPIIHHACFTVDDFDVERIISALEDYGVEPQGENGNASGPLQSYVTMRMPDRGGAPGGTPELYFTDPDGILIQLQDARYCGGNGYLGEECGTPENPTGRNP